MDVVFHIGAHRTASTSFQAYLRANAASLSAQGVGFWGPRRTRDGLFSGIVPCNGSPRLVRQARLAKGRIALSLDRALRNGTKVLIVTDENMIGVPRRNIRDTALYSGAGERLARHLAAFDGKVTRIVLSIRSFDSYWASIMAYGIHRGHALPSSELLDMVSRRSRGWREVITDLSCAAPGVDILVLPHETYGGMPERRLEIMAAGKVTAPTHCHRLWLNRAPEMNMLRHALVLRGEDPCLLGGQDGRYQPFDADQKARLRELYQDDLYWLAAGAGGLATMMTEKTRDQTGTSPQRDTLTRGQDDDRQEGRVA